MTPESLEMLRSIHSTAASLAPCSHPLDLREQLEEACTNDPTDPLLATLLFHTHALINALETGNRSLGHIHPETLVRWDEWTSTWLGTDRQTGRSYQVRTINPQQQKRPFYTRALRREQKALAGLYPDLLLLGEDQELLALPLSGEPLGQGPGNLSLHNGIRLIGSALIFFESFSESGLNVPRLSPHELRDCDGTLSISCLSPFCGRDLSSAISAILPMLHPICKEHESLDGFCEALTEFPEANLELVTKAWQELLGQVLTETRHQVAIKWQRSSVSNRTNRLYQAIQRLHRAFPAPTGLGVVGIDMQGLPLFVESTPEQLCWGPGGQTRHSRPQSAP